MIALFFFFLVAAVVCVLLFCFAIHWLLGVLCLGFVFAMMAASVAAVEGARQKKKEQKP